ncbi:MAG: response regulator [Treponemataceae bacterium]|nr:response regulator [Spirochaetales bacterium]MDY6030625.1 response regulator [Treponemataceae bacterium]
MPKDSSKTIVYSALEVANICGVVNQTVINWIKKGYLSAFSTPGNQYRVYQDDLISFMKTRNMRIPPEIYDLQARKELKNMSVLVIEDEKGLNMVLANYLLREFPDKKISSALDSFEAGMILSEKCNDVVLLDLDIKGVDGFELCKKITQTDNFGKPVVVAISSRQTSSLEDNLKGIDVNYFLPKPLNLDDLKAIFKKIL